MEHNHRRELSCASLDISTLHTPHLAALLDPGTTSHIITNQAHFINFTPEDHSPVKTANQGELSTFGQGTCIVDITIGGVEHHVTLQDCLYAPEAVFNLISVGCMLQRGWDCVFKGLLLPSGPYCKFLHKGQSLRQVPMVGNLCQLDMHFIPPARLSAAPVTMEITVFVEQPLTWDTWHACLGHPGGNSVKHLPIIATGIKVDKDTPLQHCEACIMAKHPRRPFPSSETPRANHMLDLIHSDNVSAVHFPSKHLTESFISSYSSTITCISSISNYWHWRIKLSKHGPSSKICGKITLNSKSRSSTWTMAESTLATHSPSRSKMLELLQYTSTWVRVLLPERTTHVRRRRMLKGWGKRVPPAPTLGRWGRWTGVSGWQTLA